MRLYSGSSKQFIEDTVHNQIADKLKQAFFVYYRYNPSIGEVNSWRNSLRAISTVFERGNLTDHGVILEYQLPLSSKRLDCLICGLDKDSKENAVIIELKQWDKCETANGENEVMTWVGGAKREVLHPSVQVGQYQMYLNDVHTVFSSDEKPINLEACTYLHNYGYHANDEIFAPKFKEAISKYPLFTADDFEKAKDFLVSRLINGGGEKILKKIENSKYQPSKKLMDHVGNIIKSNSSYVLLDEQLIVYDSVLTNARSSMQTKQKSVIIVKGGPGTGKSVIALNLMADLLLKGLNAHYATGSKAFTETLRKIIGARGSIQFKYFNSYAAASPGEIDVLIADESHRIRTTSNNRFTPKVKKSNKAQIEELLSCSKVAVFFIDDNQIVRPGEIGSSKYIIDCAKENGCSISEYKLEAQFRCNGSDAFVNWINNTLGIERTANVLWGEGEEFDFKILSSPLELENAIKEKVAKGNTGRVMAGFCWDWSNPKSDGTLEDDVVIGNYKRPWDARPDATKLAKGIPKAQFWAYDPNGINQVGCVYTAQGFEFDYAGVIIGNDLKYDFDNQKWKGDKTKSSDSVVKRAKDEQFVDYIKNTYRVLLSRGMKGCYVYFMDKDAERFFKSRIEKPEKVIAITEPAKILSIVPDIEMYTTALPVYTLEAAAGYFSEGQDVEVQGWMKTEIGRKLNKNMFIIKVVGKSMEPLIEDGSYCVFTRYTGGTRQGKIVLAQHRDIVDPETGGKYTVKEYQSKKKENKDETWEHEEIILIPRNSDYKPIVIKENAEDELKIIGEYINALE